MDSFILEEMANCYKDDKRQEAIEAAQDARVNSSPTMTTMDTYVMGLKDGLYQANGLLLSVWSEMTGASKADMDRLFKEATRRIEAKRNEY